VDITETPADGVLVAQGGRFGGRSLYCPAGRPCYAYNLYGRDLTTIRGDHLLLPGRHQLIADFSYSGGPPGSSGVVALAVDGTWVGLKRIPQTTAYYVSFDETFNVGVDRGTPVTDDYPPVHNRFNG